MTEEDMTYHKLTEYEEWLSDLDNEFLRYEFSDRIGGPDDINIMSRIDMMAELIDHYAITLMDDPWVDFMADPQRKGVK